MDSGDHEWELSKENVQPLRQGRHISSLVAALNPDQNEEHIIKAQKNEFELELRTYSGDDPFSVWDSYIKWTEQHFPKGGHDGQLMKLLERCLRTFLADERYTNDLRFIQMWIKFACFTEDPVDVFSYMFDNGIGVKVASLYTEWAVSLERKGDNKRADAIYMEGYNRCAEPKDLLMQRHQQFQSRVARNITLQIAENQNPGMDLGEDREKRSALGRLKVSGPSHKVGTVRTGTVKLGSAGSLKDTKPTVPKQVPSKGIQIYCDDENVQSSLTPLQSNEWQSLPVRAVDNRENDKKPGVWTNAKVKQRPGVVPEVPVATPFQIHEDPNNASHETPRKTTMINTQPLSCRKIAQVDVLSNFRRPQTDAAASGEIPMYQKEKIYNGLSEFCFEELRAIKYWKQKKEREAEIERLRKEEEQRLKEERMHQELLKATERIALLEAQIHRINRLADRDNSNASSASQNFITPTNGTVSLSSNSNSNATNFITPTYDMAHVSANQGSGNLQHASVGGSIATPNFNSESSISADSSPSLGHQVVHPFQASSFVSSTSSAAGPDSNPSASSTNSSGISLNRSNSSLPASTHPNTTVSMGKEQALPCFGINTSGGSYRGKLNHTATPGSDGPTPENQSMFFAKGSLAAPSPTVFTKEALQCVMGMFSSSFTNYDHPMAEEEESNRATGSSSKVPFEIHEDMKNYSCGLDKAKENVVNPSLPRPQATAAASERKGLQIYCDEPEDKENEVKSTSVKKSARRGLGFAIYNDVEMVDVDKFQQADFTIECQARNDSTLAPLEFTLKAKDASTPCVSAQDKDRHVMKELGESVSACLISSDTTANTSAGAPTPSKLSPIFEGSGEGSGEEAKSSYRHRSASSRMVSESTTKQKVERQHRDPIVELMETESDFHSDFRNELWSELDRSCQHQIDTTAYIASDTTGKTEAQQRACFDMDPKDPFDDNLIASFLKNLHPPLTEYPNFFVSQSQVPDIAGDCYIHIGRAYVCVEKCIGEGGYAKIYRITCHSDDNDTLNIDDTNSVDSEKVIKVQSPPCYWEFYVSCELRKRLAQLRAPMNVVPSIMEVEKGYFFKNGSVLQMNHVPQGSLLNLVNRYKSDRSLLLRVEPFACLLTIELLHMFEQIHKCGFIHGDVKPDNFLLLQLPYINEGSRSHQEVFGSQLSLVQLIDFGQSIDMTKFPQGTTFKAKVNTSGFQCIEMRTDRPWTFQTDLFGLVGTIHVVLFGVYMSVFQERGVWRVTGSFQRKWNVQLWKNLFKELLNVPSCEHMPDLASLRKEFEMYFVDSLVPAYNSWAREIRSSELRVKGL